MVQVLEQDVLDGQRGGEPLHQAVLVEQVADLNADLSILVGVEGRNAALGRAEGLASQPLLLIGILERMVGHEQLGPLRDDEVGGGNALVGDGAQLVHQLADVQRHAVADDVGDVGIERAGRQGVQGEAAAVIDDGVAGIGAALEADDDVRALSQHIGDLALALVAPVGAYDRFYHNCYLQEPGFATAERICLIRFTTQRQHYTAFFLPLQGQTMEKNGEKSEKRPPCPGEEAQGVLPPGEKHGTMEQRPGAGPRPEPRGGGSKGGQYGRTEQTPLRHDAGRDTGGGDHAAQRRAHRRDPDLWVMRRVVKKRLRWR